MDADHPCAADIRQGGGQLERYYYLLDNVHSVIGVADGRADVVERVSYGAYGQPTFELADAAAPVVERIVGDAQGFVVEFSEPVFAVLSGIVMPGEVSGETVAMDDAFTLTSVNQLSATVEFDPRRVGFEHGRAILVKSPNTDGVDLTLTVNAGKFTDEWMNQAAATSIDFTGETTPGAVLYQRAPSAGSTAGVTSSVSSIGSPFLFHGQYFDEFVGLYYLRARWYDPFTGQFLQRDPEVYTDSTNLYAGFRHNGVSYRDPSGRSIRRFGKKGGKVGTGKGVGKTEHFPSQGGRSGDAVVPGHSPGGVDGAKKGQDSIVVNRHGEKSKHGAKAKDIGDSDGFSEDELKQIEKEVFDSLELEDMKESLEKAYPSSEMAKLRADADSINLNEGDDFFFMADIDRGMVKVDVTLKKMDGDVELRPEILGRGGKMYDLMISRFGKRNIRGWRGDLVDDNLEAFEKAKKAGLSDMDAFKSTPSARIWKKHFDEKGWKKGKMEMTRFGLEFEIEFE
jgi:RHS repeat-associated protein